MERPWTAAYDPSVPATLPIQDLTVVDYFRRAVARFGDRPAVTLKGKTASYVELAERVDRLATALASLGVEPGDRIAIWMPNLPQYVISYYAALTLGAQVVNTNPLYVEREVEHQFNDAEVSVVICCDFLWWYRLRGMREQVPTVKQVIVTGIPDYLPFPLNLLAPLKLKKTRQYVEVPREPNVHRFKELIARHPPTPPRVELSGDDPAVIQYTGGTTGVSKGAVLTHRNISVNVQQLAAWFTDFEDGADVMHAVFPFFHIAGMTIAMNLALMKAAHIVLAPNPRDIHDLVESIRRYRVTVFPALPALFRAINDYPNVERIDLSSIKACFSGSAPLPSDVLERFERLTQSTIVEGFGLTEASPVTHINPIRGKRKPGTIGVAIPNTDVKIVDAETGVETLGPNREGELCVKGPQIMAGYLNRPEETAQTLVDGWLHTGDLARLDHEGYCTIVGRKKDLIIASGYNIYPDEIDEVLSAHPGVLEAATIGVPDEKRGETVKSFVVLEPGCHVTQEEVLAHCRARLAAYKVPTRVEFMTDLPKSSMMKVLRRELRDQAD